jgi:hypothetical protein
MPAMKRLAQFFILLAGAGLVPSALAKKDASPHFSEKIMQAKSVLVICECPRGLAVAERTALQELQRWGRFQIAHQRKEADLVFLFSGNVYLGDLLTRDGPDKRPMSVDTTFMTVVDAKTGENLWSDSRRWGSWRVSHATRELIAEFRAQIEERTKKWALDDVLMCTVSPELTAFAGLTPEEALAKPTVSRIDGSADHLMANLPEAPAFCRQTQLVVGANNKIVGFEVLATPADTMDVHEVLQEGDRFDFEGGRDPKNDHVFFIAQTKDKKLLLRFEVQDHKSALTWVNYAY